jgi:hypothetical protein
VVQEGEHLPSKVEALNSNPRTTKNNNNNNFKLKKKSHQDPWRISVEVPGMWAFGK